MRKATTSKTSGRSASMKVSGEEGLEAVGGIAREVLELPLLPMRDAVLLPSTMIPVLLGREYSSKAVEEAVGREGPLFVVAQISAEVEAPGPGDLYRVGVEGVVERLFRLPDGSTTILLRGIRRLRCLEYTQTEPYLRVRVEVLPDETPATFIVEALVRAVRSLFERCVRLSCILPDEVRIAAMHIEEPGALADFILSFIEQSVQVRQEFLETLSVEERLQKVSMLLSREVHILELQKRIHTRVQQEVDRTQREMFLREQLKVIQRELGELDPALREIEEVRARIEASTMPDEVRERALGELERLAVMSPAAPDSSVIRTYLDWLLGLPWRERTVERLDLREAAAILEQRHYGLEQVKERILEYIAVRKLADVARSPILCFVGPPGVGKTSLGRSIAQALNRRFVRLALGGLHDEAEIRGHRRTYIGALPGRLIQTMRLAGTINPLFMLDELDKLGADFRGDPAAALLEVLDPEQNRSFSDHYLEVPYDFSQVLFITTANVLHSIPPALRDRLEVIELPGYTEEEKLQIARHFLIPRQMAEHGLRPSRLVIEDEALRRIVRAYTSEAGVRHLERELASVMRKVARRVAEGRRVRVVLTAEKVSSYLGPQRYHYGLPQQEDEIGIATGVAWTSTGGDLTTVEAILMAGHGHLTLTGQLGEVMKESALAALSYARASADRLGIEEHFHEKYDIHLHLPSSAIPKDGPSAGVTMAVALISVLTGRAVRRDVAMTGELTLRGRVLPVGGVKEKMLAAHRAGIGTVILPRRNLADLREVPSEVVRSMHVVPVEHMDEVIRVALRAAPADGVAARMALSDRRRRRSGSEEEGGAPRPVETPFPLPSGSSFVEAPDMIQ
jgi:ATP-dependent Lon protease